MTTDKLKQRLQKPKTKKGARLLRAREPQAVEVLKKALFLFGHNTSQVIKDVLADLHKLKWQESVKYTRKNDDVKPFEAGGEASLEHFCKKTDCGLFAVGNHTKKRPHNLLLGRMYNYHLYDMVEFGVVGFKSLGSFGCARCQLGGKPSFLFVGDKFETVPVLKLVKNILLDFFRGRVVKQLNVMGLDRAVVVMAAADDKLAFVHCQINLKKSGTQVPQMELKEIGPRMHLEVRRFREAPADLSKEAHKRLETKKKEKNVDIDTLHNKVGRVYVPRQDVDSMALTKPKGVKRKQREDREQRMGKKTRKPSAHETE
ncbi:unnamed protein product [Ostreobium quekettii]|uniref:Ribosome production factor 2 homolog n=1 Tax=Ostreobium quekettii TaxID=121088 RepID=A0A8S1IP54_9CHLO|nr:unnamed protein product [Ostreobium quekettii]|eukprot:evm.model.scf_66EXC.11 EVM.evm.TU.scf_66EXC.11   scf_66EXC:103628-106288(+)